MPERKRKRQVEERRGEVADLSCDSTMLTTPISSHMKPYYNPDSHFFALLYLLLSFMFQIRTTPFRRLLAEGSASKSQGTRSKTMDLDQLRGREVGQELSLLLLLLFLIRLLHLQFKKDNFSLFDRRSNQLYHELARWLTMQDALVSAIGKPDHLRSGSSRILFNRLSRSMLAGKSSLSFAFGVSWPQTHDEGVPRSILILLDRKLEHMNLPIIPSAN